jgi:hypothetical protein
MPSSVYDAQSLPELPSFQQTVPRTGDVWRAFSTIRNMTFSAGRPGLAKARKVPLFKSRLVHLLSSSDARWRELFETADVVSEGAARGEGNERSYFGSSNIILLLAREGCDEAPEALDHLASAASLDPHVRLRAMRMARREAAQRANGPLDQMRAEITVSPCGRGVAVHVDVEAHVFPDRRATPRVAVASLDA